MIIAAIIGGFVSAGAVVASSAAVYVLDPSLYTEVGIAIILTTIVSVLNKMIYVHFADREENRLLKIVARDTILIAIIIAFYLVIFAMGFV